MPLTDAPNPALGGNTLTAEDRAALRRLAEELWDRRRDLAGEWSRRLVALLPGLFPEGAVAVEALTELNQSFLSLVLTHLRNGTFDALYDVYYQQTYQMVEADLQQTLRSHISLATLHASARTCLSVIRERLGPGNEPMLLAYTNLASELMMLVGQAYSDCREVYLQRAAETDRRKDVFLAMLSHELRNPLAPIRNAVRVLKLGIPVEPKLEWAVNVIERQVQQITRLVDDLLDVSRIRQGKITLQREMVDLASVVARAVETSRPLIDARKQELGISLPIVAIHVQADPLRLAQVVANLLNNAAKFTEEGGRISVGIEQEGDEAVLRVSDTGVGIPPDMLPRIFDLFTQADRSLDRSQGGLGIGLNLIRNLVEMHGGSVHAFSDGQGKGSEFTVRLPLPQPAQQHCGGVPNRQGRMPGLPRRILIIDDNVDGAETLTIMLRLAGHHVCAMYDGPSGLQEAKTFLPEVVLLDIGLPGMDGYEVARRLRQEAVGKQALLVALTGYGQPEDRRLSEAAGIDLHLVKPVDPDLLEKILTGGSAQPSTD